MHVWPLCTYGGPCVVRPSCTRRVVSIAARRYRPGPVATSRNSLCAAPWVRLLTACARPPGHTAVGLRDRNCRPSDAARQRRTLVLLLVEARVHDRLSVRMYQNRSRRPRTFTLRETEGAPARSLDSSTWSRSQWAAYVAAALLPDPRPYGLSASPRARARSRPVGPTQSPAGGRSSTRPRATAPKRASASIRELGR